MQRLKALKSLQGFMRYFKTPRGFLEKNTSYGSWSFCRHLGGSLSGSWKFGLFSYAQSFVGLFTVIANLGLDGIGVRELVKDESRRDELIGVTFWLKILGALWALIVLAIAVNFTSNDSYTNSLVFIIASATIFQSFNVLDMYFQSKMMGKYHFMMQEFNLQICPIDDSIYSPYPTDKELAKNAKIIHSHGQPKFGMGLRKW